MRWNWQLPEWPQFNYNPSHIIPQERRFFLGLGSAFAFLKNIGKQEYNQFAVEILSDEGMESSRIEGEILDRESLQSSIKQHFGLKAKRAVSPDKESRIAQLLCSVYESYDKPLTHEMLWQWHYSLFHGQPDIDDCGKYRTHPEPMRIVASRYGSQKIFFEAPPSDNVPHEMEGFINWFNSTTSASVLARAAIAHVYFESIHPFEDGNGRIGRLLVEKVLSQQVGRPVLIAISRVFEQRKKEYYAALERCNQTLEVGHWLEFFADAALQAQQESISLLRFLIDKTKVLTGVAGQINTRQEKALLRMFAEGPNGFKGGLSAENYIAITKASRATATRDLADLVQKGTLTRTGELRHTRYWLNLSS